MIAGSNGVWQTTSMPVYHIHFAADHMEPMPPVAGLPAVEADGPMPAVLRAVECGMVPQDKPYRWARVVLAKMDVHATRVLRVPIEPVAEFPIDRPPSD